MEAILAIDSKNGLAKDGTIPWKSKKDMNFFYNKTKNNVVIMGKNTYFSLPAENRPLKHRLNIVLTNDPIKIINDVNNTTYDNVVFTNDFKIYNEILENREKYHCMCPALSRHFKIYIIGGKQVYDKYIPLCDAVWVTYMKCDYSCDLFIDGDFVKQFKEPRCEEEDDTLQIFEYRKSI